MFWVVAAVVAGCAGGDDGIEPSGSSIRSERDAGVPGGCTVDLECAGGERCVNGACIVANGDQCTSDAQCPEGQLCRGDRCVPDATGCVNDGDCPGGGRCADGECRPADPGCVTDRDCGADESCQEGECVAASPECRGDGDCEAGQRCQDGQCVGDGMGGCAMDDDCPPGQLCRAGVCIGPRPQCDEDADCRMDQACDEGRCVDLPGCVVDGDCPQDMRCDEGTCVEGDDPECRDNADCPGVQTCQGGVCVGAGAGCNNADDCAPGERCENGACIPPEGRCRDAADCPSGSACVNGECVAEEPECRVDEDCGADRRCEDGACVGDAPQMEGAAACDAAVRGGLGMYDGVTMGESVAAGGCGRSESSPEAVYALSFAEDGDVCLNTAGTDFDTVLYVRSDCREPESELECNDDNFEVTGGTQSAFTLAVTAGETYYAFVDGYALNDEVASGPYQLQVTEGECGLAPEPEPEPEPEMPPPPACAAGPDAVNVGVPVNGTTAGESTTSANCRTSSGPEAIYRLQVIGGGQVCLTTEGSDFDTVLYVRTDCADADTEVGCNDDNAMGLRSTVELDAEVGVTYFVFVDGYGIGQGDYILTVSEGACP